jgi:hypothetical protein
MQRVTPAARMRRRDAPRQRGDNAWQSAVSVCIFEEVDDGSRAHVSTCQHRFLTSRGLSTPELMRVRRAVGRGRLERELTPAAVSRLQREQKRSAHKLLAKQTPAHRRNRHKTRRATAPAGAQRSAQMPAMPASQVAKHAVSGDITGGSAAAQDSSALVASLAALPCGLSSVVADALVCSICTEVRPCAESAKGG